MDFVVYHIKTATQFWSELEDTLHLPPDVSLAQLDSALETFVSLCASYHQKYLQTKIQMERACKMLLSCELFIFHSERESERVLAEARTNTNPHAQLILFNILLHHGRIHPSFFRSVPKWTPLIPILMDHLLVDIEETASGELVSGGAGDAGWVEERLRTLSVLVLYEVCRVQKMGINELRVFDDTFIGHLFDLVEHTRNFTDEELNYSLIKLIVALNEQFMVAAIPATHHHHHDHPSHQPSQLAPSESPRPQNRILEVLMRRLGASKTFGENMIFMLNRADGSQEALCMQLLILKMLYLLFTTRGTQEYFYTNDLCVLVDVFIRELNDLPEESESLRHTYLRVLHPLLTNTQLRLVPYKRVEIRRILLSHLANAHIRVINATTKRLVERCLAAPWANSLHAEDDAASVSSRGSGSVSPTSPTASMMGSMIDSLVPHVASLRLPTTNINASSASVNSVAAALPASPSGRRPRRASRSQSDPSSPPPHLAQEALRAPAPEAAPSPAAPIHTRVVSSRKTFPLSAAPAGAPRSAPPTPPPKRRKPPAVPDRSQKYNNNKFAAPPAVTVSVVDVSAGGEDEGGATKGRRTTTTTTIQL